MRNLVTNQIIAKFEGHSQKISNLQFVAPNANNKCPYTFVSSAGSELLLWEPLSHLTAAEGQVGQEIEEILQPAKILDLESKNLITQVSAYQAMPGAFLVSAVTESHQYVFMAKVSVKKDGKHKSKVKKPDTTISLAEKNY